MDKRKNAEARTSLLHFQVWGSLPPSSPTSLLFPSSLLLFPGNGLLPSMAGQKPMPKSDCFFEQALPPHVAQTLTALGHDVSGTPRRTVWKGSGYPAAKRIIDGDQYPVEWGGTR